MKTVINPNQIVPYFLGWHYDKSASTLNGISFRYNYWLDFSLERTEIKMIMTEFSEIDNSNIKLISFM